MTTIPLKILALFAPDERRSLWLLTAILGLSAVTETLGVASILPFMAVVSRPEAIAGNKILSIAYTTLGFASTESFLIATGVVALLALLLANSLSALSGWMILRFTHMQSHRISTRLLATYLARPYTYFLARNSSTLSKNVLDEVKRVNIGVLLPALQVLSKSVVTVLLVSMLIAFDPLLAVSIAAVVSVAYAGIYIAVRKKIHSRGREATAASEECRRVTDESLAGIKEIKVAGHESEFIRRFCTPSLLMAQNQAAAEAISLLPRYVLETLAFGGIIVVALYALFSRNDPATVIPMMTLYAFAGYRLMPALQQIYSGVTVMRYNASALEILHTDLEIDAALPADPTAICLPLKSEIVLEDLRFSYAGMEAVLHGLSLRIRANTTVAFTGPSGAGKTTLIDVLLGLLPPSGGKILVDGTAITAVNVRGWQRNLGYVPQQIYLSDDTIAANIAFGIPPDSIDREAVERALRLAHLQEFVSGLPQGFETKIGERGVRLSGGQRQRIGIARALYTDPGILILDEATSSLDNVTEAAIMESIRELSHKKTIVIIAHRLTTVQECDVIHLLDGGSIVSSGTFKDLMDHSPGFRNLAMTDSVGLQ